MPLTIILPGCCQIELGYSDPPAHIYVYMHISTNSNYSTDVSVLRADKHIKTNKQKTKQKKRPVTVAVTFVLDLHCINLLLLLQLLKYFSQKK